jgi:hypothetical protein
MHLDVKTEDKSSFVNNAVMNGVGGIFTQEAAGNTCVERAVIGNIMGEPQDRMLEPAFSGTQGTEIGMMLGKPHLIIDRTGTAAMGDEAVQLQVVLLFYIVV